MSKPLILWGASGHAKVLRECLEPRGYRVVAVFDNNPEVPPPFAGVPLYRGEAGFHAWQASYTEPEVAGLVAIGGARGRDRLALQAFLAQHGIELITAIHPTAFVAGDVRLGDGTQILAHASVCADAVLGKGCIVNTAASVDHESILEDGVHIAPRAVLAGCVTVGAHSLVAVGAVVLPRICIGRDAVVGAGAVVTHDVPDGTVVYGNPARIQRRNA